jgi:hypothetical protein
MRKKNLYFKKSFIIKIIKNVTENDFTKNRD